jgi:enhancing lycopene biosynthesis protein 2
MTSKRFAVVLSGCGHQDGAEIHEATMTLWAIHKSGHEYVCFAPDTNQHHVLNHMTGAEMAETRNVLIESARIARGNIMDIRAFNPAEYGGLVFPGGVGAAKNLCSFAMEGSDCTVNPDIEKAIHETHQTGKPIGALCIAPVLLAKVLDDVTLTIGQDDATAAAVTKMGAQHEKTFEADIIVDHKNKVVTTPCYMLQARVDQIGDSAEKVITTMLEMME